MMNLPTGKGLNHAVRVTVAALSIVLGLGAAVPAAAQCPGDLTGNQVIDGLDLAGVLSAWGTSGGELGGDVNSDGIVNGADLGVLLSAWGPCGGAPCPADLDANGVVNGADLGFLMGDWG